MGQKVNPIGFRIGVIRDWEAKWYADKEYTAFLQEDIRIRQALAKHYAEAGVSKVEITRSANQIAVTVHTARPGIVIGRGGQRVDEVRQLLEQLTGKQIRLNIVEIRRPELDAYLVAKNVAEQMERRVAYRRAMKQAMARTLQAGAKGIKIASGGRLAGAEIARREKMHQGRVPLQTLRADIDFGRAEAATTLGRIGVKVWIYKGDILPKRPELAPAAPAVAVVEAPAPAVAAAVAEAPAPAPAAPQAQEVTTDAATETSQVPQNP